MSDSIEWNLMARSAIDGRYAHKTECLAAYFSEYALIQKRLFVEIAWLKALATERRIAEIPNLTAETVALLDGIYNHFNLTEAKKVKAIESQTNHDVKAVEYYLRDCFERHAALKAYIPYIHFACTSDDINNIAYALNLREALCNTITPALEEIILRIKQFAHGYARTAMLSLTHGQSASPTTLGKEMAVFASRLSHALLNLRKCAILAKMNGAVGNWNAHHLAYPFIEWEVFSHHFIHSLGLSANQYTTQIEPHDGLAHVCNAMTQIHTILLDISRDFWWYISRNYLKQRKKEKEVGSSTMPHKVNPIDFENAEGNLGIANALLRHYSEKLPISRMQRDLSDSTVLRSLGTAFGHSLIAYNSLLQGIEKCDVNEIHIAMELDEHWEILAEAVQTLLRKAGMPDAYEKLKAFSRGKTVFTQTDLHAFIDSLAISDTLKADLKHLRPENYLGLAPELARKI